MDVGKAFSFPAKDEKWMGKIVLIGVLQLIPIFGQLILAGWRLQTAKNVANKVENPLPELDFSRELVNGLKSTLVQFAYALPCIILMIPVWVSTSFLFNIEDMNQNVASVVGFGSFILFLIASILMVLYSLFIAFILPAALTHMIVKDDLAAAFDFKAVWGFVRRNPGAYLLVILGVLFAGILASLGVIACIIGVILSTVYAEAIVGHLYGQAYLESGEKTLAPLEYEPTPPAS